MLLYPENLTQKIGFEAVRESTMQGVLTNMGAEHLETLHPTSNMVELRNRLESTQEMLRILQLGEGLPFEGLYDIRQAVKRSRVQRSILDPQSLLHIGAMAIASRRIKQFFQAKLDLYPRLAKTGNKLVQTKDLEVAIHNVLSESGDVKDSASSLLRNTRRSMHQRKGELRSTLDRVMREAARNDMTGDEGMTIRNGRMVIPVRAEYKRKIQGFVHDVSSTGQTVYLEPVEALHLNNEIRQLEIQEAQEIERLLMELTDSVRMYADNLHDNCEHIGELDLIHAIARFSYRLNGQIPEYGTAQLRLVRAKKPTSLTQKAQRFGKKRGSRSIEFGTRV